MRFRYSTWIAFLLGLLLSYILIPRDVFEHFLLLALAFMLVFSLTLVCVVRNIREEISIVRKYTHSLLGFILALIGFGAFHVCGVGTVCSTTVGTAVISLIFPGIFVNFLTDYAVWIIGFSIIFQVVMLYFMRCYRKKK